MFFPIALLAAAATIANAAPANTGSGGLMSFADAKSPLMKRGEGTFYYPEGGYGKCGTILNNGDKIVAIPVSQFDFALCGKCALVEYQGGSFLARIADQCMGCVGGDVDMTPGLFTSLYGTLTAGRVQGTRVTLGVDCNGGDSAPAPAKAAPAAPVKAAPKPIVVAEPIVAAPPKPVTGTPDTDAESNDGGWRCTQGGAKIGVRNGGGWIDFNVAPGTKCAVVDGKAVMVNA
ncbi:hypothetical protein BC828DRAFT_373788 [Blastocladiella britannica]|nr:hypothetical protein BC828DRAFT_373788 [Blastocladiella britannica]